MALLAAVLGALPVAAAQPGTGFFLTEAAQAKGAVCAPPSQPSAPTPPPPLARQRCC